MPLLVLKQNDDHDDDNKTGSHEISFLEIKAKIERDVPKGIISTKCKNYVAPVAKNIVYKRQMSKRLMSFPEKELQRKISMCG